MKAFIILCGCLLAIGCSRAAESSSYPQPNLLIEAGQLVQAGSATQFIVLDARERAKYDEGHIPTARWVDHTNWSKEFGEGDDATAWSKRIADLGLDAKSRIVVYDDNSSKDAARIWWILRYWGIEDVRLLNGGWRGWTDDALATQREVPPQPAPTSFVAVAMPKRLATKKQLMESIQKGTGLQIIDSRSEGEFCGTDALTNKRAGAMPGAKHLEWDDLLEPKTQKFKPVEELQTLFKNAGIDLQQPTATHCQGGGRAAVMAFGMELMGAKDVSNYYKSWGEWGNAEDTLIVPGTPKQP